MGIRRIQFRRATQVDWDLANPTLSEGEPAQDKTRHRLKLGDGVTPWTSLPAVFPQFWRTLTADADAINASVALVTDPVITVPVPANSTWFVQLFLIYQASVISDIRVNLAIPAGATRSRLGGVGPSTAAASALADGSFFAFAAATDGAFGSVGVGTDVSASAWAQVVVGATAGNIALQYAQRVSDPTNLLVRAGTAALFTRVA